MTEAKALKSVANVSAASIRAELRHRAPRNVPAWRQLRRAWSRQLVSRPGHEVLRLACDIVGDDIWSRLTAYELVACHANAMALLTPAAIRSLGRGCADWASVDTFACYIAGPAWREGRLPTRVVHAWLRSTDRWLRRTAVVCTVALNVRARGGRGDAARTLAVCRVVAADHDDMVVKAVSWALRSLVEWDRRAVADFLADHNEALAPRIKREVGHKLKTGRKN